MLSGKALIFGIHDCVQEAAELLKDGIDLITDADAALSNLLSYPLHATLSRCVKDTRLTFLVCDSFISLLKRPYLCMVANAVTFAQN